MRMLDGACCVLCGKEGREGGRQLMCMFDDANCVLCGQREAGR